MLVIKNVLQVAKREETPEPEVESADADDDDVTTEENVAEEKGKTFKQMTSVT